MVLWQSPQDRFLAWKVFFFPSLLIVSAFTIQLKYYLLRKAISVFLDEMNHTVLDAFMEISFTVFWSIEYHYGKVFLYLGSVSTGGVQNA